MRVFKVLKSFFVLISFIMVFKIALCNSNTKPRLTVSKDNVFLLDGRKAYSHGINYPNAFSNLTLSSEASLPAKEKKFIADLELFKAYNIPFFRTQISGYWPLNWNLYLTDKEEFFERLDFLVSESEKRNIGVIFTFLSSQFSIPDIMKEPVSKWGDRNSDTRDFFKKFTLEIVLRYKDSRAVWAWEFAENFLYLCDLPGSENGLFPVSEKMGTPSERTLKDKITRKMIYPVLEEFCKTIRSLDKIRPIFLGDRFPRRSAFNNINGRWSTDTPQVRERLMIKDNSEFDALSVHLFNNADLIKLYGEKETFESLLKFSLKAAKKARKPLFLGEWGWSNDSAKSEYFFTDKAFEEALLAIEKLKPQLTAFWVYDLSYQPVNSTSATKNTYVLEALKKLNKAENQNLEN